MGPFPQKKMLKQIRTCIKYGGVHGPPWVCCRSPLPRRHWKTKNVTPVTPHGCMALEEFSFYRWCVYSSRPCWHTAFFFKFIYLLFIYFWLCWVFVSVRGLSLVAASGGHSSSRCAGLSLSRPLFLRSTGSRRTGSAIVAHGPSRSMVCGIFPDQGPNPCPLHWQADSQPLHHQGSPCLLFCKATYEHI